VSVRFDVASGVFIRSLAHDLGKRLGYPAMLTALRRTSIGDLKIEDAISLSDSHNQ
jgi:tRNA pseudouridine55 synthase